MGSKGNRHSEAGKKRAFWLGWSFSRKMTLILILPLVVQLILFWGLFVALSQAQRLSERQFQEERLVSALDQVLLDRGTTFGGVFNRAINKWPMSLANQRKILSRVSNNLNEVRANPAVDAELLQSIDKLEASYIPEDEQRERFKNVGVFRLLQMFNEQTDELQELHAQIFRKLDKNQREYSAARNTINTWAVALIIGVFIDFCAAFASLILFSRNLTRSLRALTENSKSISNEGDLPYKLDGVDELRTIDDALHQSHTRLQHAKKQRQTVNAMIAHDVRTPLTSIGLLIHKLSAELVRSENPLAAEVERLESNVKNVHKHVEDLLVIEKLDAGKVALKLSEVNLKSLIEEVCASFSEAASKKSIVIVVQGSDCHVIGDSLRLSQVVQNYLANAIWHSPEGGEVVVQLVISPELVSVRVKDSGPGIKPAEQSQLFTKSYRGSLELRDKGMGIGLSICKDLIELHGGEVGVSSRPGAGSTFWFSLPIDDMD